MPMYCYSCKKCGTETSKMLTVAERQLFIPCPVCEGLAERNMVVEQRGHIDTAGAWSTPLLSDAAGVHPSQREEAYKHSVAAGVPTDFTKDGRAILRSRGHRKRYLKSIGLHDRDGGYGD